MNKDWYLTPLELNRANDYLTGEFIAHANDNQGRGIALNVTENGKPLNLTGAELSLVWTNKKTGVSGITLFTARNASEGRFDCVYPAQMLNGGECVARISIKEGTRVTGSRNFMITVEPAAATAEALRTGSEYSLFTRTVNEITNAARELRDRYTTETTRLFSDVDAKRRDAMERLETAYNNAIKKQREAESAYRRAESTTDEELERAGQFVENTAAYLAELKSDEAKRKTAEQERAAAESTRKQEHAQRAQELDAKSSEYTAAFNRINANESTREQNETARKTEWAKILAAGETIKNTAAGLIDENKIREIATRAVVRPLEEAGEAFTQELDKETERVMKKAVEAYELANANKANAETVARKIKSVESTANSASTKAASADRAASSAKTALTALNSRVNDLESRPAGDIVAQGSSGGWYYRKYKDGSAEAWKTFAVNMPNVSRTGWGQCEFVNTGWHRYPFDFTGTPQILVSYRCGNNLASANVNRADRERCNVFCWCPSKFHMVTDGNDHCTIHVLGAYK